MVALLTPVAKAPTYVKVANFPGLYRHACSGRYHACKKLLPPWYPPEWSSNDQPGVLPSEGTD